MVMESFSAGSLSMLAAIPLNLSSLATIPTDDSPLLSNTCLRVWKTNTGIIYSHQHSHPNTFHRYLYIGNVEVFFVPNLQKYILRQISTKQRNILQHSRCQGCTTAWLPVSTSLHTQQLWLDKCTDSHFHCQPVSNEQVV